MGAGDAVAPPLPYGVLVVPVPGVYVECTGREVLGAVFITRGAA